VDIVFYWQEDKFIILLPEINAADDIQKIQERILGNLSLPFVLNNQSLPLELSVGFALYPNDTQDGKNILNLAESKLNPPRQLIPNPPPLAPIKNQQFAKIEYLLREALQQQEFSLYYQPQIDIETGEVKSVEALIRWLHPKFGIIPPAKFLNVAEETDLIIPITDWVIQAARQQNQAWQKQDIFLPVSINISPKYFESDLLLKNLASYPTLAGELEIELTETTLLKDLTTAQKVLLELRKLGLGITLDDFGLGYAALNCLTHLPIQKLKIAQTVIDNLKKNPENTGLIAGAIALSHPFRLEVVAEGIETPEQLDIIKGLGCRYAQGNLLGKALSAAETTEKLLGRTGFV
jgi:EAL domain-containing protein (putative c-di-GMP-specific phosphodiesterase class I)